MISPLVGLYRPAIRLNIVVFPAPLGPIMAKISPFCHGEVDVVHGQQATESLGESADLEDRHLAR